LFERFFAAFPSSRVMNRAKALAAWRPLGADDQPWAAAAAPAYAAELDRLKRRPVDAHRWLERRMFENFPGARPAGDPAQPPAAGVAPKPPEDPRWERVKDQLRAEVGGDIFASWFVRLGFFGLEGGVVLIAAPTRFLATWIRSNYGDALLKCWRAEDASVRRVEVEHRGAAAQQPKRAPAETRDDPALDAALIELVEEMVAKYRGSRREARDLFARWKRTLPDAAALASIIRRAVELNRGGKQSVEWIGQEVRERSRAPALPTMPIVVATSDGAARAIEGAGVEPTPTKSPASANAGRTRQKRAGRR